MMSSQESVNLSDILCVTQLLTPVHSFTEHHIRGACSYCRNKTQDHIEVCSAALTAGCPWFVFGANQEILLAIGLHRGWVSVDTHLSRCSSCRWSSSRLGRAWSRADDGADDGLHSPVLVPKKGKAPRALWASKLPKKSTRPLQQPRISVGNGKNLHFFQEKERIWMGRLHHSVSWVRLGLLSQSPEYMESSRPQAV